VAIFRLGSSSFVLQRHYQEESGGGAPPAAQFSASGPEAAEAAPAVGG
jgi:hypothetical protein